MTERKPAGMSFTSWIDQQISEAAERGVFDNLPGAGKPLPKRADADDAEAWARDYALREGVPVEELLPTPLKLRIESARLAETVHSLRSEQEVVELVGELNQRIMNWRRLPIGPPVFVPLVDADLMVSKWRDGQSRTPSTSRQPGATQAPGEGGRSRWWLRQRRGRRQRESR